MENGQEKHEILQFRGSMFLSLVPVVIFFAFCALMFIGLKAFNMEALAMAGFIALLIGGVFCTSYTKYWNAAIKGISSVSSVSVIVIFFVIGMFSALMKASNLSGGFVWLANSIGVKGGIFVGFVFFRCLYYVYGNRFFNRHNVFRISDFLSRRHNSSVKPYVFSRSYCFRRNFWR